MTTTMANPSDSEVREAFEKALMSYLFSECQPDKGDIFGWVDDRKSEIAEFVLSKIASQPAPSVGEYEHMKAAIDVLVEGLQVLAECHPIVAARMRAKKQVWHPTGEEYTETFEQAVHVPYHAQKTLDRAHSIIAAGVVNVKGASDEPAA